ncbi:hypothetical protein TKK_0009553 [Trichogramma kaykai]|uniref:Uncharacterized protein n=1 Tax=Trichogramma kaykai TaxID=54128 RepID=A0ABD2X155_9HYME
MTGRTRQLTACSSKRQRKKSLESADATDKDPLDQSILNVIGQRIIEKRTFAQPVHVSLPERWSDITKVGLPIEERLDLIKKYPIPKNCSFLDPPDLNKEISLALNEAARLRDQIIVLKQKKLAACASGIAKMLPSRLSRSLEEDFPLVETLSDIAR